MTSYATWKYCNVGSENRVREVTCGTWTTSQDNFLLAYQST